MGVIFLGIVMLRRHLRTNTQHDREYLKGQKIWDKMEDVRGRSSITRLAKVGAGEVDK